MKPGVRFLRAGAFAFALALDGTAAARAEPVLYAGSGGWGAVSGVPESASPPGADWVFEDGLWVGRIPADAEQLAFGEIALPVAAALPPPPAPAVLPATSNPFGPCVVRSLSVRYDAQIRGRRWSLVFADEGEEPDFAPLELPGGREVSLAMSLEDVDTGARWALRPARMGREGSMFSREKGNARFYAGAADNGDLEWNLIVAPETDGRIILQGRVMLMESLARRLRWRVLLRTGAPGVPVLQAELPPAIVSWTGGAAVALFVDPAEPRRFRAATGEPGETGFEFDLAVAKQTGNFPRSATLSLVAGSWASADAETALREAPEWLPRAGGGVGLPAAVARDGLGAATAIEPARMRLAHPGGFRDSFDALQYLLLRASGLFPDGAWAAGAFLCAAQDARGEPRIARAGDTAVVAVNPDPDLETMLELGQNRGRTALDRVRRPGTAAVWLRAGGRDLGTDAQIRALHLCDYPAVWEEGSTAPAVDLGHAEVELIAALACVLKEQGVCLLVEDSGPLAPFTTYHADALVCASADPAEMRRQHALAGPRPVLWTAENPGAEAAELARNFGFVRPSRINED